MAQKQPPTIPECGAWAPLVWLLERTLRLLIGCLVHLIYSMRVVGAENVPKDGPALLVCNHVSWLDGFFILFSQPRRVRFLVWTPYTQNPFLRWLLWLGRVIPISSGAGPRAIVQALREASDALGQGEVVAIFPEASLTRTGFMLPFQRGLEQIIKKHPAPIIPTCLDRVWGSIFSYQGGRFFWKWPRRFRYPLTVAYGKPLPADTPVWKVRQVVQKLMADCAKLRADIRKPAHRLFVRMAARHPFRPCWIDGMTPGKQLNHGEALAGSVLLARKLRPMLGDAPIVGLLLPTTLGGALANVAMAFLQKTAVNLNYTASREAILSAINQCKITHVVTARAFRNKLNLDLGPGVTLIDLEDIAPQITKAERLWMYLRVVCLPGWWLEYVTFGLGRHDCRQIATIIFSSGSTGDPKGIVLSFHNIGANMESMSQAVDLLPQDRLLAVLPFFHSFGYTVTLWLPLMVGASSVYYPDPRQAKEIGENCQKWKCTLFVTTPTFLRFFIRRCEPADFATLRLLITGAEKLPQPLALEFQKKFELEPMEGYGCTELSPVACANVPNWEQDGWRQIGHKSGTVGHPIPGVAAKVVNQDDLATELPPNEVGMLMIYGANVMEGYLNRPEHTAEVIRDGWYITGDLASIDDDGFVRITDRVSRFSKIAGEMVPHQRIEDEIHHLLATTERVCAVTGVPDERKGERLVVLHTQPSGFDPQKIHRQLVTGGLPNLWLPGPESFYRVPEIPILGSGKLDLMRVKKIAQEMAAAGSK